MKGIQYITDDAGHKTAVVIDLQNLKKVSSRELAEEIEDTLDVIWREDEKSEDWNSVKEKLKKKK